MKHKISLNGVASRMKIIRNEKKLRTLEMATQFGITPNVYRKYERAVFFPPLHLLVFLAQKFGISMNWFILNKGPMYMDDIETALHEKELRKQGELPVVPPDAMIVTSPEIKDLIRFMEENPLHKFQLLTHFYQCKQESQKVG